LVRACPAENHQSGENCLWGALRLRYGPLSDEGDPAQPDKRLRPASHLQGIDRMKDLAALDAITTTVLAYRPKDKGVAAEKARKKTAREKAAKDA
jgi:hypothetical protein